VTPSSHDKRAFDLPVTKRKRLDGKEIAVIFEKTSTRTRSAFEVAAFGVVLPVGIGLDVGWERTRDSGPAVA
jgi:aspartate carbamoyltransferase catalytic subunit